MSVTGAPLLQCRNLTVRFGGVTAVNAANFDILSGGCTGLIGPNGAGKTTAIDAMTGLVESSGDIVFNGASVSRMSAHRRARLGIGRTFQSLELFDELTIRENLLVFAERASWKSTVASLVRSRTEASITATVEESLEIVGMLEFADAVPPDLSLGERKLVSVARALAAKPKLVLLDEPAAGLDSAESLVLGENLRNVVRSGIAVFLVDHDMGLVLRVCDQIHVLDLGKIIATGPPSEIRSNLAVMRAYLGTEENAQAEFEASH